MRWRRDRLPSPVFLGFPCGSDGEESACNVGKPGFVPGLGIKLNTQKTKIMASGPITSWEIDGETVKQCQTLFLGGSKITADGDCSHEIKS